MAAGRGRLQRALRRHRNGRLIPGNHGQTRSTATIDPSSSFPQGPVRITIETLPPVKEPDFKPQTELGKRLLEIRQQAIAKEMPLKTTDEILAEIREDRREANDDPNLR